MHNHGQHTERLKQYNILSKTVFELLINHRRSAIFDDHYFIIETLDI